MYDLDDTAVATSVPIDTYSKFIRVSLDCIEVVEKKQLIH